MKILNVEVTIRKCFTGAIKAKPATIIGVTMLLTRLAKRRFAMNKRLFVNTKRIKNYNVTIGSKKL